MLDNNQIVKNAAITTGSVTEGLLQPYQAQTFIRETFEKTVLGGLVRREMRRAKTGEINKIGIDSRILRRKVENIDANADGSAPTFNPETGQVTGYRAKPHFSQITYATKAVRLPWEVTEETYRENIEGQGLEATITTLMTTRLGNDLEDIWLNGDEATPDTHLNQHFLYIDDGWIKQISKGGHVTDAASHPSMNLNLFYDALMALPNKYNNGNLRWIMSPRRAQEWELFLLNQGLERGASFPDSLYNSPAAIPTIRSAYMPDDKILLTDPKNLIVINTYDVKIRKTNTDVRSIMEDKRFYVVHLDFDTIIEELDATCIIENVPMIRRQLWP